MSIKLMSFNVEHCKNEITQKIDFDAYADVIRRHNVDIIGLNEVYDDTKNEEFGPQAKILAEKLGYDYYFAKAIEIRNGLPYGNAILSRFPIISAETIPVPDPEEKAYDGYYETRCLLKAKIDVCGGITLCVIHFGLNPDEQENAQNTVLSNICDEKCILMGDFNVTPDNPLIASISERMFDTADLFVQDLRSWPSDDPTMKIDYIFSSHDIKVLSADIPAEYVSDHRPHIAVIVGDGKHFLY